MQNSTKVIIGLLILALIGGAVYFGNSNMFKGFIKLAPKQAQNIQNVCKSEPTGFYFFSQSNPPEGYKDYEYTNFEDFYNYVKKELDTYGGKVLCPYQIKGYTAVGLGDDVSHNFTLTCKGAELSAGISSDGKKYIDCKKELTSNTINDSGKYTIFMGLSYALNYKPYVSVSAGSLDSGFSIADSFRRIDVKKY